jgi:glycine/D-amino acid oxidase-like deaminating enzyme
MAAASPTLPNKLDLLDKCDVCVAGGGLSGVAAAMRCAEAGLDTIQVEQRGALGWEISHGLDIFLSGSAVPARLKTILDKLVEQNAFRNRTLDPVATEVLLDTLVQSAKVRLHFRAHASQVSLNPTAVIVTTKSGPLAIQANAVIDATETSRLARNAGAQFNAAAAPQQRRAFLLCAVTAPTAKTEFAFDGVNGTVRPTLWPHEAHVSITVNVADESKARRAIAQSIEHLRKTQAGFEKASLSLSAHEGFALNVPQIKTDSLPENLFVAGPSVLGRHPSIEERVQIGDKAAALAVESLRGAVAK